MQAFAMYGYYTTFALRSVPDLQLSRPNTPYNRKYGPRDIIETLVDILHTFSLVITEENEFTPTPEFHEFLERQLSWLGSIDEDTRLYNFQNKSHITELKSFLTYPHPQLHGCIERIDEITDIAIIFRDTYAQVGTRVLNTLPRDAYLSLHKEFAGVNSHLAYILRSMPPADYETMKENNRDLYRELNAYIMHPTRVDNMYNEYGLEYPWEYLDAIAV